MKHLLLVLSLILSGTTLAQIPANGLVCEYPLNGNANDASANGNHGVVHGATPTADRFGAANSAYRFTGDGAYIEVPQSNSLSFGAGLTVAAWVRTDPEKPQYGNAIVTKGVDIPGGPYPGDWTMVIYNVNNAGLRARPHVTIGGDMHYYDGSAVLQPGVWYHLVMTYDGSTLRSYVNGVPDGSTTYPGSIRITNSTLRIGVYDVYGAPTWFAGDIDDVLIYDRALTSQEITSIYAIGSANLNVTVQDVEGWGPLRSTGLVTLYDPLGAAIKTATTNASGTASFVGIPAGTGYSYGVTDTKTAPLGPSYWGARTNLDFTAESTVSETFTRNMPYAKSVRIFDQGTGTEVTGGTVLRGTPVRLVLGVAPSDASGSTTQKVGGAVLLDRDQAAPYDLSTNVPPSVDLAPGGTPVDLEFSFTPKDAGIYYYSVASTVLAKGVSRATDATGWSSRILVATNSTQGEYSPTGSTAGLWHMNESSGNTVADASSNANHGSADSALVDVGKFGLGRSFNGRTSRIVIPPSASMAWATTRALSIEAWVKPDDARHQAVAIKGDATVYPYAQEWGVALEPDGTLRFKVNANADNSTYSYLTSTRKLRRNAWNHIACVWNGVAGTMTAYVNGAPSGTIAAIGTMVSMTDKPLTLGFIGDGPFKGAMDECLISSAVRTPGSFDVQLMPGALVTTPGNGSVGLAWSNGGGATALLRYKIYRGTDSSAVSLLDSTTATEYTDTKATSPTGYYYRVSAVDETGFESEMTAAVNGARISVPPPAITAVVPAKGKPGTAVTISGTNFSTNTEMNTVFFGGVKAVVTGATPTALYVTVPFGATYAPVTVLVNGLTAYAPYAFMPTFDGSSNPSDLAFAPRFELASGQKYRWGTVADLDLDGRLDLVEPNNNNSVSILWNNSVPGTLNANSFLGFQSEGVGNRPYMTSFADLNGDGRLDLATVANSEAVVSILKNTGGGQTPVFTRLDVPVNAVPQGTAMQDLDGDGKVDIVASGSAISVLRNTGVDGQLSFARSDITTDGGFMHVTIADIDGDNRPDIVAARRASNGAAYVTVYRNLCEPGMVLFAAEQNFAAGAEPKGIAAGDLDDDGKLDVAITTGVAAAGVPKRITVFKNTSTPSNVSFAPAMDLPDLLNGAWKVVFADINGDGRLDVLAPVDNGAVSMVSIYLNTGSTGVLTFAPRVDIPSLADGVLELSIGDLDRDGKPDLTLASLINSSNGIAVHRNLTVPKVNTIAVTLPVRNVLKGTSIDIPVTVGDLTGKGVISYQFTLKYNTPQSVLTIAKDPVTAGTLSAQSGWSVTTNTDTAGQITVGAFGANPLTGAGTLVILKGQVNANASAGQQSDLNVSPFIFNAGDPQAAVVAGRLTVTAVLCGDADGNGSVQAYDAALTVRDAIGIAPLSAQGKLNADVDLNGLVQAFDAALILRKSIGLPPPAGVTTCFAGVGKEGPAPAMLQGLTTALSGSGKRGSNTVVRLRFSGQDVQDLLALSMLVEAPATRAGEWTIRPVDLPADYVCTMHHPAPGQWAIAVIHPYGLKMKDLVFEIETADPALLNGLGITSIVANTTALPDVDLAEAASRALPKAFALVTGYPNPFNPSTSIVFDLPVSSPVTIEVFNILGVHVRNLVDGVKDQGRHEVQWDGTNDDGRIVSTGQYFCRMKAGDYVGTIRLMMLK